MFYGQCWKCGERWALGTASTCKCPDETPQRTWVNATTWQGLTDDEINTVAYNNHPLDGIRTFARAIEAAHNIKGEA